VRSKIASWQRSESGFQAHMRLLPVAHETSAVHIPCFITSSRHKHALSLCFMIHPRPRRSSLARLPQIA
jgi:hypothetical protein